MTEGERSIQEIMDSMAEKDIPFIERAGEQGVQILCLQEIFNTPYFCPGQDAAWYASAAKYPWDLGHGICILCTFINATG